MTYAENPSTSGLRHPRIPATSTSRDQRPAFNQMLKDAVRRRFDVCMVWSIDRLGRSILHVASAMAELDAAGVALHSDQQAIDSSSLLGQGDDRNGVRAWLVLVVTAPRTHGSLTR